MFKAFIVAVVFFSFITVAVAQEKQAAKSSEPGLEASCAAGSSLGAKTTYEALVKKFGAANVKKSDIDVGEGETQPGAVVFPDDPERRLEVIWNGPDQLSFVIHEKSRWKSAGISLGTSLKQVERLNGKAFNLAGFGWDYSGTVNSWNGGQLQPKRPACRFIVRFSPDDSGQRQELVAQVSGEQDFSSAHPVMQQLNPRVYEIVILWAPPPTQ